MLSTCDLALSTPQYQEGIAKNSLTRVKAMIHNKTAPEDLEYVDSSNFLLVLLRLQLEGPL